MQRRAFLVLPLALATHAAWSKPDATLPPIDVFKTPTCGCCGAWVDHLRENGFTVRVTDVDDTSPARRRAGIPESLGSCHTGFVGGYGIEGHVPAKDIKRLLAEKPDAAGLTVPGMVTGSPGMEMGSRVDPHDVLLVGRDGRTKVYARYGKRA